MGDQTRSTSIRLVAVAAIAFYGATAHLTCGHQADFGKQWLAARLVAIGQGPKLFDLDTQRAELERQFDPAVIEHGIWRDGIGGPTYPPPLAILYAPLGWLSPRWAAWVVIELSIAAVIATSFLLKRLTAGNVTWEMAVVAALTMPSFFLAIGVGQNSAFSLLLFVAGLYWVSRHNDFAAGFAWGLFAFKPTLGLAVVWLPVALRRPRVHLGMFASAAALVAISLAICGLDAWLAWLRVARQTELYYQSLPRWTALSRDVPGLLRRVQQGRLIELAGWAAVFSVAGVTAWVWRSTNRDRFFDFGGPASVALSAGALLSCPRFMFYDMTLAVVPVIAGIAAWDQLKYRERCTFALLASTLWLGTAYEYLRWSMLGPPLDTFALIGLWLWGIRGCVDCAAACDSTYRSGAITGADLATG